MKKISISLLLFASMIHSMEMPPQKPAQESVDWQNAPRDIKRIIQTMVLNGITTGNLQQTVKNINNFALVNKDFHDFLNSPNNIIELLTSITKSTPSKNEYVIIDGLKNMPGMQHIEVKEWIYKKYPCKRWRHLTGKEVPQNIVASAAFNSNEPLKKGDLVALRIPALSNLTHKYIYGCFSGLYNTRIAGWGGLIEEPDKPVFVDLNAKRFYALTKEDFGKIPEEMIP